MSRQLTRNPKSLEQIQFPSYRNWLFASFLGLSFYINCQTYSLAEEPVQSRPVYGSYDSNAPVNGASDQSSLRDGLWGTSSVHYDVLSRPAGKRESPKPRTWAPEVIRPVTPYAYGYFGPSGSNSHRGASAIRNSSGKSWYRQFGHQHSYVNYSLR